MKRRTVDRSLFEVGVYEMAAGAWVAVMSGIPTLVVVGSAVVLHGAYVCARAAGIGDKSLVKDDAAR